MSDLGLAGRGQTKRTCPFVGQTRYELIQYKSQKEGRAMTEDARIEIKVCPSTTAAEQGER